MLEVGAQSRNLPDCQLKSGEKGWIWARASLEKRDPTHFLALAPESANSSDESSKNSSRQLGGPTCSINHWNGTTQVIIAPDFGPT